MDSKESDISILSLNLLGQFALQLIHYIAALFVVSHLGLDEGVQMTQMGSLRGANAVQQQLSYLRLAIELGLSHAQITFRLAMMTRE